MEKTTNKELPDLYFSSLFGVIIEQKLLYWIVLNKHHFGGTVIRGTFITVDVYAILCEAKTVTVSLLQGDGEPFKTWQ